MLLAERSQLGDWAGALRNRSSQVDTQYVLTGLGVLAAIVLALWGLSYLLGRHERRRSYDNALVLFHSLCKAHGLALSERWLLWRIARRQRLRDPARLFLEPRRLAAENLSPTLRAREPQLKALRERLYAGLEGAPAEIPPPVKIPPEAGENRQTVPAKEQEPSPLGRTTPFPNFPVAENPALDLPPWTGSGGAGSRQ